MRILMLADFYPPFAGGVARHVSGLSRELVERGHEVAVATFEGEGLPRFEIDHGVRVYRIRGTAQRLTPLFKDSKRRWAPPFPDPELTWAIRGVIALERPDIVHAHTWLVNSFLPLKAWSGAKLVLTLHEYGLVCAKKNPIYRGAVCDGPGLMKCLGCSTDHYGLVKGAPAALALQAMSAPLRRAVDLFLPVSSDTAMRCGLIGGGLPYQVIPNFVPATVGELHGGHEPYQAQLPREDYLLFVGALGRHKGVPVLLDAYAGLVDPPPLVLIGIPWPDMPVNFPANVTVLENWPHDAVMEAWSRSRIALVPSVVPESFGIVVIEAMASGRPVIASRIGGLPELVEDGETGLLVPPGDPAALRGAIARLLADRDLAERMGQAGRRKAREFRTSNVIPWIERAYHRVMHGRLEAGMDLPEQPASAALPLIRPE
jgi:glycosyltransferase involved in cell wall biosynthesis